MTYRYVDMPGEFIGLSKFPQIIDDTPEFKGILKNVIRRKTEEERRRIQLADYNEYLRDRAYAAGLARTYITEQDKIKSNFIQNIAQNEIDIRNELKQMTPNMSMIKNKMDYNKDYKKVYSKYGRPGYGTPRMSFPTISRYSGWQANTDRNPVAVAANPERPRLSGVYGAL
jgi:hypothetical protein